jgi:hypothetical protein
MIYFLIWFLSGLALNVFLNWRDGEDLVLSDVPLLLLVSLMFGPLVLIIWWLMDLDMDSIILKGRKK